MRFVREQLSIIVVQILLVAMPVRAQEGSVTREVTFESHDGYPMRGRLTLPPGPGPHPVVVYAQTAEGMTMEVRRPLGRDRSFSYLNLYADSLPPRGVAFFRYEGRGIGVGSVPPRFETIDTIAFNTSTLDNKVRDLVAAIEVVRVQSEIDTERVILLGASEGTLLIADAATRVPDRVAGLVMYGVLAENMRETSRFIFSDGAFLPYRRAFDSDGDGVITPAEFDADPNRFRATALGNASFAQVDADRDGEFSVADVTIGTQRFLDAIDQADFEVLHAWSRTGASVAIPDGWWEDHWRYPSMWDFVSQLDIPIGLFQGEADAMTPVDGVRRLEARAAEAGKVNMRFRYFADLDHALGLGSYFGGEPLPEGHRAIFAYVQELIGSP